MYCNFFFYSVIRFNNTFLTIFFINCCFWLLVFFSESHTLASTRVVFNQPVQQRNNNFSELIKPPTWHIGSLDCNVLLLNFPSMMIFKACGWPFLAHRQRSVFVFHNQWFKFVFLAVPELPDIGLIIRVRPKSMNSIDSYSLARLIIAPFSYLLCNHRDPNQDIERNWPAP